MRTRATGHGITRPAFGNTSWRGSPIFRRTSSALELTGAKRQNPVSFRPVYKATLRNLVEWIETGKEPPNRGTSRADRQRRRVPLRDRRRWQREGRPASPHMPTVLANGEHVGAPLGVYRGLDPDYEGHPNYFAWIGGTFEPFSAEELTARYPSHDAYVELVTKAAAALLADRFILQEDHDAYIRSAELRRW